MVDLAGSETVKKTGAEGQTLKEAQVCTHVYIYTHYYYLTYIAHSADIAYMPALLTLQLSIGDQQVALCAQQRHLRPIRRQD